MTISELKIKPLSVVVLLVSLVGLILGIYLVTHSQIFKSRAATNISQAFEITDDKGNQVQCVENVCNTSSLNINIKVKDLVPLAKER